MSWSKGRATAVLALLVALMVAAVQSGRRREVWHSLDRDLDSDEGP